MPITPESEGRSSIPQKEGQIVNYMYQHGEIIERKYEGSVVHMRAKMDRKHANKVEKFMASVS